MKSKHLLEIFSFLDLPFLIFDIVKQSILVDKFMP